MGEHNGSTGHPNGTRNTGERGRSIYLETFGCQMNELDSELVRGQLLALGYRFVDQRDGAAIVLYNTCSVREQAENKVLSRVGEVGIAKREGREVVLGVIGCMAEREGAAMMKRYPQIDLLCGPGELDRLPGLLDNALRTGLAERSERIALQGSRSRRSATLSAVDDNLELLDLARAFDPDKADFGGRSAYVRITRGCNKFCTYCVVPYTRGAEVHRPPDAIIDECRKLADRGVIEITLLGQTVNHYCYTHGASVGADGVEAPQVGPAVVRPQRGGRVDGPASAGVVGVAGARTTSFADLLKRIHDEVPTIRRLRFVTSFPRDFGDDVLAVMADSPRICRYLHVPAQSGSNRILKMMNRGYTVEEYVEFIDRARAFLPDVCIAGDFIVGFPTETEEDFAASVDLIGRVGFKNNFVFKYSPRPGTVAIDRFVDDVPEAIKRRRNNELLAVQNEVGRAVHDEWVGRTVEVFVQRIHETSQPRPDMPIANGHPGRSGGSVELRWEQQRSIDAATPGVQPVRMTGRTGGDLIVSFDLPAGERGDALIGTLVPVRITASGPILLLGEAVQERAKV